MSRPSRHSRSRRRDSRGAAALEAALITPLVMIMVFGIIEMALLMRDDVALTSLTRSGGRVASANADKPGGGVTEGGDCLSPCTPSNAPMFAQMAANAIQNAGTAIPKDSITELWVYKANNKGYPGSDNSTTWTCGSNCVIYRWNSTKAQFRYYSGTWIAKSVNACANNPPDSVGIYMLANHKFLTSLFSSSADIDDHAVFQFEPLPALTCSPNTRS